MTRPAAPVATARTFSAELAKRTRNSGLAFSVVVFLGCPTWRVFDQMLDPQAAPGFWPIRLVVSGLTLAVWIPALIVRSRPRLALLATMATASSVQVAVAWMLLQTTIAFDTYLLCLILGPICTGALIQWHWRYPLALVAITVAALGVMSLAGTRQLTERNLVTTLFVLSTTSILVGIGHYISYQVSYREFTARKDAEHARAAAEQARIEAESQRERNLILLAEVEQLSREDALTGIANRRAFDEALAREIARADRNGNSFGLIMLDVDHFKHLNDTFGHQSGDAVLHTLAQRLVNAVRGADLVARFGGEEFAVILVDTREEDLADAAESVRARMVTTTDDGRNSVTASAGAALYPRHGHRCRRCGPLHGESCRPELLHRRRAGRRPVTLRPRHVGRQRTVQVDQTDQTVHQPDLPVFVTTPDHRARHSSGTPMEFEGSKTTQRGFLGPLTDAGIAPLRLVPGG